MELTTGITKLNDCDVQLSDCRVVVVASKAKTKLIRNPQIRIDFVDLTYEVQQKKGECKKIIQDVSGSFRPGMLTAILGPSGAGKTSLLNIIAGRRTSNVRGTIAINNVEDDVRSIRKDICYIPQDFSLFPNLTTREALYIAVRLKLGCEYDGQSKKDVVVEMAEKLGLMECLDTRTENLSGGERKRLSIGLDLITSPPVLLLDEPTSGLDSASSNQVIRLLHSISRTGCTVVCAVHQPSSQIMSLFDDVLIMAHGKCFYSGRQDEMLDVFSMAGFECSPFYNIAEFVLEVVVGEREGNLTELCKIHASKTRAMKFTEDVNHKEGMACDLKNSRSKKLSHYSKKYAVSDWEQMNVLLHRSFICMRRDKTLTLLRFAAHLVVGILIGLVFYNFGQDASKTQSNIACIFFFAIFLFFANAMPAVQMFPPEALVFLQENGNNWYRLRCYYVTKVLSDIPMQIICPLSFLTIAYCMTGQPMEYMRFSQVWIVCTLLAVLAQSFGIATGAMFGTHVGMFLVPAFNIPMFLFAGFFLKLGEVPWYLKFLSEISFFRYVFEGIIQAVYGANRPRIDCPTEFCYLRTPKRILDELNMPSVSFVTIIVVIVAWLILLHSLIYFVLQWKTRLTRK